MCNAICDNTSFKKYQILTYISTLRAKLTLFLRFISWFLLSSKVTLMQFAVFSTSIVVFLLPFYKKYCSFWFLFCCINHFCFAAAKIIFKRKILSLIVASSIVVLLCLHWCKCFYAIMCNYMRNKMSGLSVYIILRGGLMAGGRLSMSHWSALRFI